MFVGGIEFRPVDATSIVRFDPFNAHVSATNYKAFASILGTPLLLDEGVIDWSFQYSSNQNGPIGGSMPVEADTVNLATVARLPGLADVQSYPKQPINGFADYTVVTDASVMELAGRFPSLATKDVVFPLDAIGLREIPKYTISVPSVAVQKLFGLDVSGSFSLQPVARGGALGIALGTSLALPDWLSGFSARFAAFFPVNGAMQIDEAKVDIPLVDLGAVRFKNVTMNYDNATDSWSGFIGVLLGPGDGALGFDGRLSIVGGKLQSVGVSVTGLPIPIGGAASIRKLGGLLSIEPLGIRASAQVGLGPNIDTMPGVGTAASVTLATIDGEIVIDTEELSLNGALTIAKIKIRDYEIKGLEMADARIAYYWDGLFSVSGNAKFFFDKEQTWGLRGGLRGGITADAVSLGGDVSIGLGPFLALGGTAAISTRGWIACGQVKGLWFKDARIGISYDWGQETARLRASDCNTDEYQVPLVPKGDATRPGRNASGDGSDGASQAVEVRADQKMVSFAIDGAGATITGPDGTVIDATGAEQSAQSDPTDPRWMVVHQPGDSVSYVFVARPAAGTWTVTPGGGATPTVTVSVLSERSEPLDATAEVLKPTSAPTPLSTHVEVVVASSDTGSSWPTIIVVLVALGVALAVALIVLRRRPTD